MLTARQIIGMALLPALVMVLAGGVVCGETWHLKQGKGWEKVADDPQGEYLLAVSNIKQLISQGDVEPAMKELNLLKSRFPDMAGADLDAFITAEKYYAKRKWVKAVRKYDEFLDKYPQSGFYESALEREYSVAVAFLKGEKIRALLVLNLRAYDEGEKIMHKIADRTGDAPIAKRSLVTLAESFEKRSRYYQAYETWVEISSRWPTGELGRRSLLAMAVNLHSAYNGPKYDQTSITSAQSFYREYKVRYGQSPDITNLDDKINLIDEQSAYKQLSIGQYYERTGSIGAANLYYQLVVDTWPQTSAAKVAEHKLAYGAADGSVQTGKKGIRRKMFDFGNSVVDNWFGLSLLKGKSTE